MQTSEQKYTIDADFRGMVDTLRAMILEKGFGLDDVNDAAIMAYMGAMGDMLNPKKETER